MSAENGDGRGFSIIEQKVIPDTYADSVQFEVTVWGVTLEFGLSQMPPPGFQGKVPHIPRVRVHMSPQHAKVMAKIFVKNVQAYEKEVGTIAIPTELYKQLGLEEQW
jgi:hypothetical protein